MKKRILMCCIILLSAGATLLAHKEYPADWTQDILEADTVVIAVIEAVTVDDARCESRYTYRFRVLETIKGNNLSGKECVFNYSLYHPTPAQWPWQEDCLSVHYRLPSLASRMQAGEKVVVFGNMTAEGLAVRGVIDLAELDAVRSFLQDR